MAREDYYSHLKAADPGRRRWRAIRRGSVAVSTSICGPTHITPIQRVPGAVLGRTTDDRRAVKFRQRGRGKLDVGPRVAALRGEEHVFAVGREVARIIRRGVGRDADRFAAGRRHDEHVEVPMAIRREGDLLPVVRPDRHEIVRVVDRQRRGLAALGRDEVDVAAIGEGDLFSIRRDGRITQPERFGRGSGKGGK